jgi:hypothetical protein
MLGSGVHLILEPVILTELFCQQEVAIYGNMMQYAL